MHQRTLAYEAIVERLRRAIEGGLLPDGIVLLEGPIAALFSSSRSPVKRALSMLEEEGLIRRFDGRGYLSGKRGGPLRSRVTVEMLDLQAEPGVGPRTYAWQSCYYDFEKDIILRAVFGQARINELAMARHYRVGRSVASDMLNRAARTGLVTIDGRARWVINPLNQGRFRDLYELRMILEPAALRTAIAQVPKDVVRAMRERLCQVSGRFPNVETSELDELEEDLHIDLLQFGTNSEILEALGRTRCILVAGKHIQRAIRNDAPIDAFMGEHLSILDAIIAQDAGLAEQKLVEHLMISSQKATERLQQYLKTNEVLEMPFVVA